MHPDQQRIDSIFLAAAEKTTAAERAAYLDVACASDPALRERVERLLAAQSKVSGFLEAAAPALIGTVEQSPLSECPGTQVGPYKLLEPIGEGGMGTVWMAQQTEPIQRRVAVKVVKEGMDSRQVLARFEAERQALALMEHPNIARVLDAGKAPSGRPYFVMELVKGQPITKYCDEKRLGVRERLELFGDVCRAVQHAHQKGIIHRDLKPSNVLVAPYDGKPVVKVIDFGVAKAAGQRLTDKTLFTGFGALVGTPEYMSPEQAEVNNQDIDTRSDIYSLGVLLYELLTSSTPLTRARVREAALLEVLRVIREEEPPRPSTRLSESKEALPSISAQRQTEPAKLTKLVRGELDWIVMKALEKDRSRRYETANGFARDIQRYLADEPVEACPPSRAYRLRKFARKNRKALVTASAFLVLLVTAAFVSTWLAIRALQAETTANTNANQARLNAEEAERSAQKARDEASAKAAALEAEQQAREGETRARQQAFAALRSMTADVVERKFAEGTVLTEDDHAFLRGVIAQYDAFALIKGDDADTRAVRAEGRLRVGNMRYRLGEIEEAERDYDHALSTYKQLAADFPSRHEFRRQLAASHANRGRVLRYMGRLTEAEAAFGQSLRIQEQLAADFPARPEFRQELASSHADRGVVRGDRGCLPEAEKDYDQALRIQEQLAADFPARPEFRQVLALTHNNRGKLLGEMGRHPEAEKDYDQALGIYKQLAAAYPAQTVFPQKLAMSYNNRGTLLGETGRLPEAEKDYDQALRIQKQLAADYPARPEFRMELARSHNNRGQLLQATGRVQEAEKVYDQALSIQRQLAAEYPARPEFRMELARSHNNRGQLLHNTGRLLEAEQEYGQALHSQEQLAADFPSHPEFRQMLAVIHNNRGHLLCAAGRLKEAEKDFDQALQIYNQLAADFPSRPQFRADLAVSGNNRANLLFNTGRLKEAEKDYDQALRIQKQLAADFPARLEFRRALASTRNNRGLVLSKTGRLKEAEQAHNEALSIRKQLAADFPNQPDLQNEAAGTCVNLALLHEQQGNWGTAKRLLLEGRPYHLAAQKANPRHPTYRRFYRNHLGVLIMAHAWLLEQEDAVRTAETCRDLGFDAPVDAYDAACSLCWCVPIAAKHEKLDDQQRKEAAQFYADQAMKLLREAVGKGYKEMAHIKKDTDLDPLRSREDFQKLVAELDQKRK
jgi:serine/threonine protein kinase/tetratricopeptide (TPR) repeat protein